MNPTSAVSVAFDPLLPWPVLAGAGRDRRWCWSLLGLRAGARGTLLAAGLACRRAAALANPALIEEQRKPIADVALVVIDDSDSMAIGERRTQVAGRARGAEEEARPAGRPRSPRGRAAARRTSSSAASGRAARA